MAYTAAEIIDDVLGRVDDEEGKISRTWLLHLLNMAQIDYAKRTHAFKKEGLFTIDTQYNAFRLPEDILEIKKAMYSCDSVSYTLLYPMDFGERQEFNQQVVVAGG